MSLKFQYSLTQGYNQGSSIEVELTRPDAGVKVLPEVGRVRQRLVRILFLPVNDVPG